MELIEIIRWVSIVLMWGATALNIYALIRGNQNYKKLKEIREKYEKAVEETWAARDKYYDMIEEYRKRFSDEGSDNDRGD